MPQLDFFIFSQIALQTTFVFLLLALFLFNTAIIQLFKNLRTRYKLVQTLEKTIITSNSSETPNSKIFLLEKEINEKIILINKNV